jgi:DnaJ like chaperone protein
MSIWGKIIGGTAGFALGGPIGAMLGIMVGGSLDRTAKRFKKSNEIPNQNKQKIFVLSIIILSAKIAKADGEVTKDEIHAFKEKFNIPSNEMHEVGKIFNEAKKTKDGYKEIADQIGSLFSDNGSLLEELLNNLFYIAESDGVLSVDEIKILKSISNSFRITEQNFQRIFHSRLNNKDSDPYKVLSVKRDDDDITIRKRWIQLSKEHHPDNLLAKGLPSEFIEEANKELSSINLAYDKIKTQRGIS